MRKSKKKITNVMDFTAFCHRLITPYNVDSLVNQHSSLLAQWLDVQYGYNSHTSIFGVYVAGHLLQNGQQKEHAECINHHGTARPRNTLS